MGLAGPIEDEYDTFGGPTDPKKLAARLDEVLAALDLLWSGEPATYLGSYVTLKDVIFQPTPVQRPRVPIWVGGQWPHKAPMRRAARWDGAEPLLPSAAQGSPDPGGSPGATCLPRQEPSQSPAREAIRSRPRRNDRAAHRRGHHRPARRGGHDLVAGATCWAVEWWLFEAATACPRDIGAPGPGDQPRCRTRARGNHTTRQAS
ncbi:LLM class flavin-dependent oxidoreductase [Streptomyces sp. NPDC060064]|uniref:LLM class flavin-dependent oxidoreductase n=1 Tax=Streptomyces sp. NPDC060064 TaxID=3347049 RepID=UPI00368E2582